MKLKYIYGSLLFCLVLFSCKKEGRTENFETNKLDFSVTDTVAIVNTGICIYAEDWMLTDSGIVCKTDVQEAVYTILDKGSFEKKYSFGQIGHGKNEWTAPHVLAKTSEELMVFDNGNKKLYTVTGDSITSATGYNTTDALNDAKTIAYPAIAYVSATPNEQELKIVDLEKEIMIDSISFVDQTDKGQSLLYDFVWDSHDDRIVIAHQHSDRFIICTTDDSHKITEVTYLDTDKSFSFDRFTYSDIACGHYIYLLSQKNVNPEDATGSSEIEIYDYDGKCIRKLVMITIADKILLDEANNRLLSTSIEDGSIIIINL